MNRSEQSFLWLGFGLGLLIWISFILAEFSHYSLSSAIALWTPIFIGFFLLSKKLFPRRMSESTIPANSAERKRVGFELIGFLVIVGLCIYFYFPPMEWVIGWSDAGSYTNSGQRIAREGTLVFRDSALAEISQEAREGLFSDPNPGMYSPGSRLIGLFLLDDSRIASVPHAFHLYPVTLAIGYSIGGMTVELLATPMLALLSTIALFLIARRLGGPLAAFIAGSLFAVNLAQTYFARYPAAEIQGQFLLFSGLLAFLIMYESTKYVRNVSSTHQVASESIGNLAAVFAGFFLGLGHLNKIELIAVPAMVVIFMAIELARARWRKAYSIFLVVYLLLLAHTIYHSLNFTRYYTSAIFGSYTYIITRTTPLPAMVLAVIIILVVILYVVYMVSTHQSANFEPRRLLPARLETFLCRVFSICSILLFGYLYFIRPRGVRPDGIQSLAEVSDSIVRAVAKVESLERVGWYLTRPLLLLGILGLAYLIYRGFNWQSWVVIIIFAVEAGSWLRDPLINPLHFYAARRYLTFLIPGFIIFASILISSLPDISRRLSLVPRWLSPYVWNISFLCGLLLVAFTAHPSIAYNDYVEYQGSYEQFGSFANKFPEDAILLFDSQDTVQRITLPIQMIFDRTSIPIFTWVQSDSRAMPAIREWIDKGHPVYWITAATPPGFPAAWEVKYDPVFEQTFDLQETLGSFDHPATPNGRFRFTQQIYRLSLK